MNVALPQWWHNNYGITTVAPQNHGTITMPPQKIQFYRRNNTVPPQLL